MKYLKLYEEIKFEEDWEDEDPDDDSIKVGDEIYYMNTHLAIIKDITDNFYIVDWYVYNSSNVLIMDHQNSKYKHEEFENYLKKGTFRKHK